MQSISPILVPTDFSARSLGMMPYVKAFSERYEAEVVLLHVVDPVYAIPETGISPPALIRMPPWVFEQRSAQLETFASAELAGLPVRRLVYDGDPESQIAATAEAEHAGLLIMPTHGLGVFRRFLIGSVTAKVLHDVDCPVLTGTHAQEQAHANPAGISKIAYAIDLSPQNEHMLAWALGAAATFQAELGIVYVVPRFDPDSPAASSSELREQVKELVKTESAKIEPISSVEEPEICIEEGEVPQGVCHFAESFNADLLIVGRGSHTERLRTNTYAIIRQSPCPVFSV